MTGITLGKVEHPPRGQNQEGLHEQCRLTILRINPCDDIVNLLNIEMVSQNIVLQMEQCLDDNHEKADNN